MLAVALFGFGGEVWADDECGTTATVTCSGDFANGIRYRNQNELTLTVGATSGSDTITAPSNGAGIRVESRSGSTGDLSVEARPSVEINQNAQSDGRDGIFVLQRGTGGVRVQVDEGAQLGTEGARLTDHGIFVGGMGSTNDGKLTIISNGIIFVDGRQSATRVDSRNRPIPRFGAGIIADRNGAGGIEITHGGEIDSLHYGIRSYHNGAGNTVITNSGRIESGFRGIEARNAGTGDITITHSGRIVSGDWGIFARQDGAGGAINIQSSGDIETTGTEKSGIHAEVRATGTDPLTVTLQGGTILATGNGVNVNNIRGLGAVTVSLTEEGAIGTRDSRVGAHGISANIQNSDNDQLLHVSNAGEIFSRGIGISASRAGSGGIKADNSGSIDSMSHRGMSISHNGSGDIEVTNSGSIVSRSHGILTHHVGLGATTIKNTGSITAGGHGIRAFGLNAGRIDVTHEGSIVSTDHGIFARHDDSSAEGGVHVTSRGDIRTTGYRRNGIYAEGRGDASTGSIFVHHERGRIESYRGITLNAPRFSGSTFDQPDTANPAEEDRPVLRVVLAGGEIKARALADDLVDTDEARTEHQVGWKTREVRHTTFDGPTGIVVGTIDTQRVSEYIAGGDIPVDGTDRSLITDEVRMQFRAVLKAATDFSGSPRSGLNLGNLFDPRSLVSLGPVAEFDPSSLTGLSDDELDAYLTTDSNGETVLSRFLKYTLSSQEAAVVEALFRNEGLQAALNALPDTYTDEYKNQIRWYAQAYNNADVEVEIADGARIESEGDGIRVTAGIERDENGKTTVKVKQGATVIARRYGVRVVGAGIDDRGTPDEDDDVRDQTVEVEGHLESTGTEGIGVYLIGGGKVAVGSEGRIIAASGVAVQAVKNPIHDSDNAPRLYLTLELDGRPMSEVLEGEVVNDDGETRIVVDGILLYDDAADGVTGQWTVNGARDVSARKVDRGVSLLEAYAPRAMLYEGLPGLLLRLDGGVPEQRPEDATWAQVEYGTGKGKPDRSSTGADYDHDRIEAAAGISRELGEDVSGSLWLRRVQAEAELDAESGAGELDLRGWGAGAELRWRGPDGWEASGQLSYTDYDVDASSWRGALARDVGAKALSVGLEAKYGEFQVGGVALRPRAWARHTQVEVDDFTDALEVQARFSDESRTNGGLGLRADMAESDHSWYGTVDVERLLGGEETAVSVSQERLESEAERTQVWIGFGGERRGTRVTLRGGMRLGDPGGKNQEWMASLSLGGQF